ncbi:MAG: homocysteine S-methyltransferase family protein [Acidobacteriota bacterium]
MNIESVRGRKMDRKAFRQSVETEVLILDGAQGTFLLRNLPAGYCFELASVEKPEIVAAMHAAYVNAGADIISTNTFGATRIKLQEFGLGHRAREINAAAARLARRTAGERAWVAGCIGPTGKLIAPMGPLDFDETYELFHEQALALAEGGVDLFLLETFSDLKEAKIAVMAVREAANIPIMASMTFDEGFKTFMGTDPITAANVLASLCIDALGVNCSTGPEPMLEVLGRYAITTETPLFVEPNAGIPRLEDSEVVYHISPDEMASYGEKFVEIGACIVGSCCGSTPEYTAELHGRLKGKKPHSRRVEPLLRLSSRLRTVEIGPDLPFCVIGERINPTNREELAMEIRKGKVGFIQREARSQAEQGAHLLDVNIGVPNVDEAQIMAKVIRAIENAVNTPLSIDSVNPKAVEAALRESAGKPLINSVNGEEKSLEAMIPLAKRFGAGLLCLAVGGGGIPNKAEERLAVLKRIVERAEREGIPRQNLICDCLTLTVSAQQKRAEETLRALRMVKEELGLPTVLGVSNISYGLPERSIINATFLSMAMASGLDAAILNPDDARMMESVQAASVLTVRDRDSREYIQKFVQKRNKKGEEKEAAPAMLEDWNIFQAMLMGNRNEIGILVEKALASGRSALEINSQILIPAIQEVGRKYDCKEIYLPQMMLAAETMQQAFKILEPHFGAAEAAFHATVLLCTVKGDVHDIGKNIVALFLKNHGFKVIDLGKDVSVEDIVRKAQEVQADIVGLSALMTTTMVEMPVVIEALRKAGSKTKVVVGGAVVTKKYAQDIGADGYGKDAVEAVKTVKSLVAQ